MIPAIEPIASRQQLGAVLASSRWAAAPGDSAPPADERGRDSPSAAPPTRRAGCTETVRRVTHQRNSRRRRAKFGGNDFEVSRLTWSRKAEGTTACRQSGGRSEDVYGAAPQHLSDMVKAGLLEP